MTEEKTFKQNVDDLEGIVRSLESGNLELEESLSRYEKGVALIKDLSAQLNEAEQKINELMDAIDEDESND